MKRRSVIASGPSPTRSPRAPSPALPSPALLCGYLQPRSPEHLALRLAPHPLLSLCRSLALLSALRAELERLRLSVGDVQSPGITLAAPPNGAAQRVPSTPLLGSMRAMVASAASSLGLASPTLGSDLQEAAALPRLSADDVAALCTALDVVDALFGHTSEAAAAAATALRAALGAAGGAPPARGCFILEAQPTQGGHPPSQVLFVPMATAQHRGYAPLVPPGAAQPLVLAHSQPGGRAEMLEVHPGAEGLEQALGGPAIASRRCALLNAEPLSGGLCRMEVLALRGAAGATLVGRLAPGGTLEGLETLEEAAWAAALAQHLDANVAALLPAAAPRASEVSLTSMLSSSADGSASAPRDGSGRLLSVGQRIALAAGTAFTSFREASVPLSPDNSRSLLRSSTLGSSARSLGSSSEQAGSIAGAPRGILRRDTSDQDNTSVRLSADSEAVYLQERNEQRLPPASGQERTVQKAGSAASSERGGGAVDMVPGGGIRRLSGTAPPPPEATESRKAALLRIASQPDDMAAKPTQAARAAARKVVDSDSDSDNDYFRKKPARKQTLEVVAVASSERPKGPQLPGGENAGTSGAAAAASPTAGEEVESTSTTKNDKRWVQKKRAS